MREPPVLRSVGDRAAAAVQRGPHPGRRDRRRPAGTARDHRSSPAIRCPRTRSTSSSRSSAKAPSTRICSRIRRAASTDYLNQQGYWKAEVTPPERTRSRRTAHDCLQREARPPLPRRARRRRGERATASVADRGAAAVLMRIAARGRCSSRSTARRDRRARSRSCTGREGSRPSAISDRRRTKPATDWSRRSSSIKEGPRVVSAASRSAATRRMPADRLHAAADAEGRRSRTTDRPSRAIATRCWSPISTPATASAEVTVPPVVPAVTHGRGARRRRVQDRRRARRPSSSTSSSPATCARKPVVIQRELQFRQGGPLGLEDSDREPPPSERARAVPAHPDLGHLARRPVAARRRHRGRGGAADDRSATAAVSRSIGAGA